MALNRWILLTLLIAVAVAAELVGNASAATYTVGDSLGWTVPRNGPAAYTSWASNHTFSVGDVLVFNFSTGNHDVAHVTKGAFDGCSSNNPIALTTVGPASFTLNSTGPTYYICTFGQHCSLGQKLAINVSAASTSPSPTPAPNPPPTNAPTPTPAPAPAPSPSPSPSPPSPSPSPSSPPSPSGAPSSSPTPSGVTPPPAPASESTPGANPPGLPGSLSPPPPPSSATITSVSAPLVVFALAAFCLLI